MVNKKMNILMVMPKVDIGYQEWAIPPVGITYVSAALKQKGFNVFVVNMNLETDEISVVLEQAIEENDIDLVATGGLIVNYHTIKEIMDMSKKIKPSIITYIGGSLVTFSPKPVMQGIQSADIGMIGEGEITACELMDALESGASLNDLKEINGLIIRMDDGELYITPPREEIMDIDSLPWPDYDGFHYFEMIKSFLNSDVTGVISAPLTTSRSCPFRCTFCSKSGGEKYRQRSLDSIFEELDYLVNVHKVNRIFLNDELFANDSNRIMEFCNRIKDYGVQWFVSLRISKHITRELLEVMKSSGCIQILYGLESGDDTVLKSMRKGITTTEMERVVRLTADSGFQVRGNFIFGDPAETMETVSNTISFIEKNVDVFTSVALSPIILFPGSELYKSAVKNGIIDNELEFIEEECPLKNVSGMSDEEYFKLVNEILPKAKAKLNAVKTSSNISEFDVDVESEKYWFEHSCPKCDAHNRFYVSDLDAVMRTCQYSCPKCGQTFNVNITYKFAQIFYRYFKEVCKQYKTALWGCGQNMAVINEYVDGFDDLDFWLIDTDVMKIGKKGIGGRNIYSPDIIKEYNIEFVIEMTSVRHFEIINRINREFKEVKHAYSMFDIPLFSQNYIK